MGNTQQAGISLTWGFFPSCCIPKITSAYLGKYNSIQYGSIVYAFSLALLGLSSNNIMTFIGLFLLGCSAGIVLPASVALLTIQIPPERRGSMQGAIDSVRVLTTTVGFPLFTSVFGYSISDAAPFKFPGAALIISSILASLASVLFAIAGKLYAADLNVEGEHVVLGVNK